jgi:hypothetical protein
MYSFGAKYLTGARWMEDIEGEMKIRVQITEPQNVQQSAIG